jgi:predicted kinase
MCDESGHLNDLADVVTEMYLVGIKIALRTGVDVVVDDVHAEWKYVMPLVDIAAENGAECEIVDVPASLEECLSRNKQRTGARRVTEQVVRNAYEKIAFHRESDNDE